MLKKLEKKENPTFLIKPHQKEVCYKITPQLINSNFFNLSLKLSTPIRMREEGRVIRKVGEKEIVDFLSKELEIPLPLPQKTTFKRRFFLEFYKIGGTVGKLYLEGVDFNLYYALKIGEIIGIGELRKMGFGKIEVEEIK
ncbi:MAG: hypothetical protein GXO61_01570 [Epsilonproteobacteria bacterium]|nr:hypothetical protein [Campylobacterota bacterium]